MKFGKLNDNQFLVRFERGEEFSESIKAFCQKQDIKNATFTAIGSMENVTLAHYKVDNKNYSEKTIEGVFEVTSLLGTVGLSENDLVVHSHIVIGDENMQAYTGHLVKGTISATLELTLTVYPTAFQKKQSEEIGLKLFDLLEKM